jgi:hypothetical protein
MRVAVQYFSSSFRLGPPEEVADTGGWLGCAGVGAAEWAGDTGTAPGPVGRAVDAAGNDGTGVPDCIGVPNGTGVRDGTGVPVAASAWPVPSMPAHRPSARAGIHLELERNEVSFRLGGSRTAGDIDLT